MVGNLEVLVDGQPVPCMGQCMGGCMAGVVLNVVLTTWILGLEGGRGLGSLDLVIGRSLDNSSTDYPC